MLRFRPVQKHKTQLPPETLTALFQTQWMEAEILMSEGCDDHILLMLCVIFSQYSKVNSRWADTWLIHTQCIYTGQLSRLRAETKLFLSNVVLVQDPENI